MAIPGVAFSLAGTAALAPATRSFCPTPTPPTPTPRFRKTDPVTYLIPLQIQTRSTPDVVLNAFRL